MSQLLRILGDGVEELNQLTVVNICHSHETQKDIRNQLELTKKGYSSENREILLMVLGSVVGGRIELELELELQLPHGFRAQLGFTPHASVLRQTRVKGCIGQACNEPYLYICFLQ